MKKELLFYTILVLAVGILIYIQFKYAASTNPGYTRVIDLKPFNKMYIDLNYPVYVSKGEEARIAIEGPSDRVEDIILKWHGGELTVGMRGQGFLDALFSWFSDVDDDVSIYIRLPQPALIEAPCTVNIITNEDIPGLDSCRHMTERSKFSDHITDVSSGHPFTWIIRVAKEFDWERLFQMHLNLN